MKENLGMFNQKKLSSSNNNIFESFLKFNMSFSTTLRQIQNQLELLNPHSLHTFSPPYH